MAKFAAIGDDGMRPVVWGIGETERLARRDAEEQAHDSCCGTGDLRIVEVSAERAARIEAGDVDASDL